MKHKFSKQKLITGIILIGVIIIMGIFGMKTLSPAKEINEEKSFSLKNIKEIQVSVLNETIHIIQTETGEDVKFHLYGKSKAETTLNSEIGNEKIVVIDNRSKCGSMEEIFLDIYVPKDYSNKLSVKVTSGDTRIDTLNLSSFSLNCTSGKIEIGKIITDNLELKSSAGDISLSECYVKVAAIETSSGKVNIGYQEFENGKVNIKSSSGNINLSLPISAEFLLKAQTNAGKIQNDFSNNQTSSNDKKIELQIGTKTNEVTIKSSSGSINIIKNK